MRTALVWFVVSVAAVLGGGVLTWAVVSRPWEPKPVADAARSPADTGTAERPPVTAKPVAAKPALEPNPARKRAEPKPVDRPQPPPPSAPPTIEIVPVRPAFPPTRPLDPKPAPTPVPAEPARPRSEPADPKRPTLDPVEYGNRTAGVVAGTVDVWKPATLVRLEDVFADYRKNAVAGDRAWKGKTIRVRVAPVTITKGEFGDERGLYVLAARFPPAEPGGPFRDAKFLFSPDREAEVSTVETGKPVTIEAAVKKADVRSFAIDLSFDRCRIVGPGK